jgi:hypothetical protein
MGVIEKKLVFLKRNPTLFEALPTKIIMDTIVNIPIDMRTGKPNLEKTEVEARGFVFAGLHIIYRSLLSRKGRGRFPELYVRIVIS